MSGSKRATTIKDIAAEIGVSVATVSQALRPNPNSNIKLPERTINRVKEAATALNYRAHRGAMSIRSRQFKTIGFFSAKKGKAHSPDGFLDGLHDAAESEGYRIFHVRLPDRIEELSFKLPSILNEQNLDALVIGSFHPLSHSIHEQLRNQNLPVVYLNDRHPLNSIYVDDYRGAQIMTQHLMERGHRKICFVLRKSPDNPNWAEMHHSAKDRWDGFKDTLKKAGLQAEMRTVYSDEVVAAHHIFPADWEEVIEHFDALFAYDDDLANQIARYLYARNLHVPQAISLCGYNGDYGSHCAWQDLTTISIPTYKIGKLGFKMVKEILVTNEPIQHPSVKVNPILVEGKSVRDLI